MKFCILRPHVALATFAFFFFIGATIPAAVHVAEDTSKCFDLSDGQSPLAGSLASFRVEDFKLRILHRIVALADGLLPGFSQCAANTDATSFFNIIATSNTLWTCGNTLAQLTFPDEMPDDNFFRCSLCPPYKDTIVPCINDGVAKDLLVATMDQEGGCCNQLKSSIADAFGADLTTTVDVLLKLVGNSLCSAKTFPSETQEQDVEQTCVYSIVAAVNASSSEDDDSGLGSPGVRSAGVWSKALQMKREGVCSAATGHQFRLTSGETAVIESSDVTGDDASYGICFQPMSVFVEHVNKYPIIQRLNVQAFPFDFALADLFGGDTCVTQTQLALPLLSAGFTTEYAVSIFMDTMVAFFEEPSSTEPMQSSSGDGGAATLTDAWAVDRHGPIPSGGSADAVESKNDDVESTHSLAGRGQFSESSSSGSSGSGLSINEFLGDTLASFGAMLGGDGPSSPSNEVQATDDDAPSMLGGDENEFGDDVSPDVPLQPCCHVPHDLTCDYGREAIQLMFPEMAATTPLTAAPAIAPSVLTVQQRLRQ